MRMDGDVIKVRSLGRQLLSFSGLRDVMRGNEDQLELVVLKMLKRWRNAAQKRELDESALVRELV